MRTAKIILAYFGICFVAIPLFYGVLAWIIPFLEAATVYVAWGFDSVPASVTLRKMQQNSGPDDAMVGAAFVGSIFFIIILISRAVSGDWPHERP